MIIKRAENSDLNEIRKFMLGIIRDDFGYTYNPEWHWDIKDLKETYLSNNRSILLVAMDNGSIVGTIAGRPYDKSYPEFVDRYHRNNTMGVWRHYIEKEKRGAGIGKKMYATFELFAKENAYDFLYLHTQKTIPGSKEYWLKRGFIVTIDKNDKLGTVHMEKSLLTKL